MFTVSFIHSTGLDIVEIVLAIFKLRRYGEQFLALSELWTHGSWHYPNSWPKLTASWLKPPHTLAFLYLGAQWHSSGGCSTRLELDYTSHWNMASTMAARTISAFANNMETSINLFYELLMSTAMSTVPLMDFVNLWWSTTPGRPKCNKVCGMCYPVCGMMHIKEPLLLIGKSSPCGGSGFPLSLSEWSFTICLTPYKRKSNVLSVSLNKTFPSFLPYRFTSSVSLKSI